MAKVVKQAPPPPPPPPPSWAIAKTIIDARVGRPDVYKSYARNAPATQTTATPATSANARSYAASLQPVQQADSTAAGSMLLSGSSGTGGGYQGIENTPMGSAGREDQFLRRIGSILLR